MSNHAPSPARGLAVLLTALGSVQAQDKAASQPRVFILGASVSAGVVLPAPPKADQPANRSYTLKRALRFAWDRDTAKVYSAADARVFLNPLAEIRKQCTYLRKRGKGQVALVFGIDLPFWLGYGYFGRGKPSAIAARRLARLDQGLELLAKIDAPMLLGDFPDMSGADPDFLRPTMVPAKATLALLNKRLRSWVAARPKVQVMPLARFTAQAIKGPLVIDWNAGHQVSFPSYYLLQTDRLHANRLGVLVLMQLSLRELPALLGAEHPLAKNLPSLEQLVKAADLMHAMPGKPILRAAGGGKGGSAATSRRDR